MNRSRLADPLPAGFLALAVATWCFAALQLGWVEPSGGTVIALVTLTLTVPVQLLVSIVSFVRGELAAATGMAVLSGTWAGIGLTTSTSPPGSTSDALGFFLVATAVCMAVAATSSWTNPVGVVVMGGAAVRFAVTAGYQLTGRASWMHAAGWVGVVLAVLAVGAALFLAVTDSRHATT